jgi:hypothetical protein
MESIDTFRPKARRRSHDSIEVSSDVINFDDYPAWNSRKVLPLCLKSLAKQTIDDGE